MVFLGSRNCHPKGHFGKDEGGGHRFSESEAEGVLS